VPVAYLRDVLDHQDRRVVLEAEAILWLCPAVRIIRIGLGFRQ
jgi:hypothetical protein